MNQHDSRTLETAIQGMQWEAVALSPSQEEVQVLDQQLPQEWLQLLVFDHETGFSQEEGNAPLHQHIEVLEGDIDKNARQAIKELGIDIEEIMQELDHAPSHDMPDQDHDHDFGR